MTKAQIQEEVEKINNLLSTAGLIAATKALNELCTGEPFTRFKEIAEIQFFHASIAGPPNRFWIRGIGNIDKFAMYEHAMHWTRSILAHLTDVAADAKQAPTFPTQKELEESKNPPHNSIII